MLESAHSKCCNPCTVSLLAERHLTAPAAEDAFPRACWCDNIAFEFVYSVVSEQLHTG